MKKILMVCTVFLVSKITVYPGIPIDGKPLSAAFSKDVENDYGRVILVTGSCSSGKSSLSKIIAQRIDAQYFAFDEYVIPIVLRKMVEKYVGKVIAFFITKLVARNFFTIMGFMSEKRKYTFQKRFYAELHKGIAVGPTARMYREVKQVAMQGCDVVVEAPLQLGDGVDCLSSLSELQGLDITFVLAYCPWKTLVERIKQRNKLPNKTTHRELDWALGNFIHCFTITTTSQNTKIDIVDGAAVKEVVATYSNPIYKKKRLYMLRETQEATLQTFNTSGPNYIYPRLTYDVIVNTGNHTPEQAAEHVLDALDITGLQSV